MGLICSYSLENGTGSEKSLLGIQDQIFVTVKNKKQDRR